MHAVQRIGFHAYANGFRRGKFDCPAVLPGRSSGGRRRPARQPFVRRCGQLLTRIIEACGFRRQDVYILNSARMPSAGESHAAAARGSPLPRFS